MTSVGPVFVQFGTCVESVVAQFVTCLSRGEYFTKILQTFPKDSAVNSSLKVMRKSQFPSKIE